jgi:Flp pilus assembly pilin Flp
MVESGIVEVLVAGLVGTVVVAGRVAVAGLLSGAWHTAGTNAKRINATAGKWNFRYMPTL